MATTRRLSFWEMPGCGAGHHAGLRPGDARLLRRPSTASRGRRPRTSWRASGGRTAAGTVRPGDEAHFRTRIVVRRPSDPDRFSGTVVVEWHNVSAGIDAAPDWGFFHRHLAAQGHAWVGVSAQKVGIDGGGFVEGIHLKLLAPERYARPRASGRRVVLRHLHPGRRACSGCRRREPAGWRPGGRARARGRRVPVRGLPGDLHQRRRSRTPESSTASSCTGGPGWASPSTACSSPRRGARDSRRRPVRSRPRVSASARTPGCPCSCCRARPT